MNLVNTKNYIHKRLDILIKKTEYIQQKLENYDLEKQQLFHHIQLNKDKIDTAYDILSPNSVKNNFVKEQIQEFESKIDKINSEIEKSNQKLNLYKEEIKELQRNIQEIENVGTIETGEIETTLNPFESSSSEIQCIDISKNNAMPEKNQEEEIKIAKSALRDIIYKCENCSAFMNLDINRSKIEIDSIIKKLKYYIQETDTDNQTLKNTETNNSIMQSYEYDEDDITKVTSREREILILISNGMSNKEIANELNITERTVKNHITNLFKKINVCDRTQAAVYAIKNNIVLCENSYPHI